MINQIFIGGHGHSGTRVVHFLLEQSYNTFSTHETRDGDENLAITIGKEQEPFIIKNANYMLKIPVIKEQFPESKFILVVRNGIDQILTYSQMFERWETEFNQMPVYCNDCYLKRAMMFWNLIYKKAVQHADYTIKLEDLVYNTKEEVKKLADFLTIPVL